MNEGIKFIPITGYSSHMSVNIDDTVNEDREMKNLNLENITKFLSEEDFARVKLSYLFHMNERKKVKIKIVQEKEDPMLVDVTKRIKRKLFHVYYEGKNIFSYLDKEERKFLFLFNSIFILNYINTHYYIANIKENYNIRFKTSEKIKNMFLDITKKTKDSTSVIVLCDHNNQMHLKRIHFSKCEKGHEIQFVAKILIKTMTREHNQLTTFYPFGVYYEITSTLFMLLTRERLFLFENLNLNAFLLCSLDISFSNTPYPYVINEGRFGFLSSENFYYRVAINSKHNEAVSIFKDVTLNFNNEKYREMLEHLKVIMYYNIEIDNVPFTKLHLIMGNVFQDYDVFSYIQNISLILNEENIHFFIKHNIESSKLQVIIIFCLLYDKVEFLRRIFELLLPGNKLEQDLSFNKTKKINLEFVAFVVFFEDFIYTLIREFESIDTKSFLDELNRRIFGNDGRCSYFVNFYLQRNFFKNGSESKDNLLDKYVELFTLLN